MASDAYGLRLLRQPGVQRLALGVFLGIVLAYRALQVVVWTGRIQWGYDFSAYWRAGRNLLDGHALYTSAQLAGPYAPQQQFLYLYPPPLAAFATPLSLAFADYRAAQWLWFGLGLVILVAAVLAVGRAEHLGDRFAILRGRGAWWLVAGALALPPVVAELVLGNVHLEILGLLSLAWLGLRRGTQRGELLAGAAIGVAALVKVFPGLLVLWLLLTRRYRAALAAVAAVAILTAISLPVTGFQPWRDYPTVLANLGAPSDTTDTLAPTVWLTSLLGYWPARVVVTAAGLAIVPWVALRAGLRPGRPAASSDGQASLSVGASGVSYGAAVATSVLIAPAVYQHYLAILVLPFLLALSAGVRLRWLALAYLLMWGGEQPALGDLAWVVNKGLPTCGAVLLLATLIRATGSGSQVLLGRTGGEGRLDPREEAQEARAPAG